MKILTVESYFSGVITSVTIEKIVVVRYKFFEQGPAKHCIFTFGPHTQQYCSCVSVQVLTVEYIQQ